MIVNTKSTIESNIKRTLEKLIWELKLRNERLMLMQIKRLEDFIKNMPEDVRGIIPKARYLYLELGKRSFYDPEYKYFMFGEAEENLAYIHKLYSNPNIIISLGEND